MRPQGSDSARWRHLAWSSYVPSKAPCIANLRGDAPGANIRAAAAIGIKIAPRIVSRRRSTAADYGWSTEARRVINNTDAVSKAARPHARCPTAAACASTETTLPHKRPAGTERETRVATAVTAVNAVAWMVGRGGKE